jgi:hypothetical protein
MSVWGARTCCLTWIGAGRATGELRLAAGGRVAAPLPRGEDPDAIGAEARRSNTFPGSEIAGRVQGRNKHKHTNAPKAGAAPPRIEPSATLYATTPSHLLLVPPITSFLQLHHQGKGHTTSSCPHSRSLLLIQRAALCFSSSYRTLPVSESAYTEKTQ